jgi:hypothetical protein
MHFPIYCTPPYHPCHAAKTWYRPPDMHYEVTYSKPKSSPTQSSTIQHRQKRKPSANVKPKPNIPPKETISMPTPMRQTSTKRLELIATLHAINSSQTLEKYIHLKGLSLTAKPRSASDTSHSAISSTDYTEKERQV